MALNNFTGNNSGNNSGKNNGGGIPLGGGGLPSGFGSMPQGQDTDAESLLINYNKKTTDPAMFRDDVIQQMLSVLIMKDKPNPLMVGPAGVGKTRVVEEIARRLEAKDPSIPSALSGSVIYELPLSNIVANSSYVGQVEGKLQSVIEFAEDPANRCILFIDEIHQLCSTSHTNNTIAQILKPALSRGAIKCIGATTTQEARFLFSDPALNRRFSRIIVDEFTQEQTVELLKAVKPVYIKHYANKVVLDDAVMPDVARYADEYHAAGSHRPDNALTLLDHAIAEAIIDRNVALQQAQAANDQMLVQAIQSVPYVVLTEQKLKKTAMKIMTGHAKQHDMDETVLFNQLSVIKGQDDIAQQVVKHLKRKELGLFRKKAPLALMFAGSSGVGKTEMAKIVSRHYTGLEPIILNMTEYSDPATINRIIGSPAGYVGSDSASELPFDCLESNPFQFILLDEFEKAHPAVQRLFMSVLDEGTLQTNRGTTIDFSRTILIATTNAAHTERKASLGFGTAQKNTPKETVDSLSGWFDSALLNRFTQILTFHPISKEIYRDIVAADYERSVTQILAEHPRLTLAATLSDDELDDIVARTYVPDFGARPAQKAVDEAIENQVL